MKRFAESTLAVRSLVVICFFLSVAGLLPAQYCTPTITTAPGIGISNVQFNLLNHTSPVAEGYVDYTAQMDSVVLGNSYDLVVTPGTPGQIAVVFIDWDQDNTFAGTERYYMFSMGAPLSITVPLTAVPGNTRMRILTKSGFPPINFPCDNLPEEGEDYSLYVDNAGMRFLSATADQALFCNDIYAGGINKMVLGIEVVTTNPLVPIDASEFFLQAAGTTVPGDITNARIWYTGQSNVFAMDTLFGSLAAPGASFSITGTQQLQTDTNYFWLTMDISGTAIPGNFVDVQLDSLTIDASTETPLVSAPTGNLQIASLPAPGVPTATVDYAGTEFWIHYPYRGASYRSVRITGDVATTGTVALPGLSFAETFCFNARSSVEIALPIGMQLNTNVVEDKGIHITADNDVLVSMAAGSYYSADEILFLPVTACDTAYHLNVIDHDFSNGGRQNAFFTATEDNTTLRIYNTGALGPGSVVTPPNGLTTVTLDEGQTYLVQQYDAENIRGTRIRADRPVYMSASVSTYFPNGQAFADGLIRAALPDAVLGTQFAVPEIRTGVRRTVRIFSPEGGNEVRVNGTAVHTLCQGESYDVVGTGPVYIETLRPASVAINTHGEGVSASTTDPSTTNIQPLHAYLNRFSEFGYNSYLGTTDAYTDSLILVVPSTAIAATTVGGTPLSPAAFQTIPGTTLEYAILPEPTGYYDIISPAPVMAYKGLNPLSGQGQNLRNMYVLDNPPNSTVYDTSNCLVLLPIEIQSFSATCTESGVRIEWETDLSPDIVRIEVERSRNGFDWEVIESEINNNNLLDQSVKSGNWYYRLRVVDADHQIFVSDVQLASCGQSLQSVLNIWPNPANSELHCRFSGDQKVTTVEVFDARGQKVRSLQSTLHASGAEQVIDLQGLPAGLYHLVLRTGHARHTRAFVIARP